MRLEIVGVDGFAIVGPWCWVLEYTMVLIAVAKQVRERKHTVLSRCVKRLTKVCWKPHAFCLSRSLIYLCLEKVYEMTNY